MVNFSHFILSKQTLQANTHFGNKQPNVCDIAQRRLESDWNNSFSVRLTHIFFVLLYESEKVVEDIRCMRVLVWKNLAHRNSIYLNACSCQPTFWQSHQIENWFFAVASTNELECAARKKEHSKFIWKVRTLYVLITHKFSCFNVIFENSISALWERRISLNRTNVERDIYAKIFVSHRPQNKHRKKSAKLSVTIPSTAWYIPYRLLMLLLFPNTPKCVWFIS